MIGGDVVSNNVKPRDTRATNGIKNVDAADHPNYAPTKAKAKASSHLSPRGKATSAPGLDFLVASIEEKIAKSAAKTRRSTKMEVNGNEGSRKRATNQTDAKQRKRLAVVPLIATSTATVAPIAIPMGVSVTAVTQPAIVQPPMPAVVQPLAQPLAQPLLQPLGQPPPPPHNHTVPDNAEESVPRTFRRLWAIDPKRAERYAADQVYAHNANVPYLLGKAVVLREHYVMRRSRVRKAAAAAGAAPATALAQAPPEETNPVIYYGSLAAARRVMVDQCYCVVQSCGDNCVSLTNLFGPTETDIKSITDRILEATYGTADQQAIQSIRASLRKQKIL